MSGCHDGNSYEEDAEADIDAVRKIDFPGVLEMEKEKAEKKQQEVIQTDKTKQFSNYQENEIISFRTGFESIVIHLGKTSDLTLLLFENNIATLSLKLLF